MRHLAVAVAAALVFALVAPAFAQPFADVPTNHWAYDAIAELAAKGIVEGFPDGTFRGDRAMTRFEMAMIVARLLARIESIQIPAPAPAAPAPAMTAANIAQVQRLVNEFRAELAALGVRVTAIEEELNAIKARLDNVRITGAWRFRYNDQRTGATTGTGIAGNPNGHNVDAGSQPQRPDVLQYVKLSFDGTVAPDVHLITAILNNGTRFNSANFGLANNIGAIDNLFFDWKNVFGWPLEIWLGRFGGDCCGTSYPVQFGPFGLLMNTGGDTWEDSSFDSGTNVVDGLRFALHWADLADLKLQALIARVVGGTSGSTFGVNGEDAYGLDANIQVLPGLRVGAYYVWNGFFGNPTSGALISIAPAFSLYHVYGPGGGAQNPSTAHCPTAAVAGVPVGILCPAAGNGPGVYADWTFMPGITLDAEYAQWNDNVLGGSDTGYQANIAWDLGTLTGVGHNWTLSTGYLNYGQNFYPPYGAAEADLPMNDTIYPGNAQGFLANMNFDIFTNVTLYGIYFTGNNIVPNLGLSEWQFGAIFKFLPNTSLNVFANAESIAGIQQFLLYRAQLDYTF